MKTTRLSRPVQGFTLVELLVVIAIIAVLAAMGFAGAQAAISKAKKVKARKICVTLEQGVMAFYNTYGYLPTNPEEEVTLETGTDEGDLITILLGYEEGTDIENEKKIRFFEAPEAKGARDGIVYAGTGNSVTGLFDPWGEPYRIILDGDYDETLKSPFTDSGKGSTLRGRRAAVFTYGKNGEPDDGSGDDVKSW